MRSAFNKPAFVSVIRWSGSLLLVGLIGIAVEPVCWLVRASSETPSPSPERDFSSVDDRTRYHGILDRATHQDDGIHDTCLALVGVGDASSVPHLIRVLKLFPDVEIKGKPGMGIICTQFHCVAALEHSTRAKVGVSYSSWKRWWDVSHPGNPLEKPPNNPLQPPAGGTREPGSAGACARRG